MCVYLFLIIFISTLRQSMNHISQRYCYINNSTSNAHRCNRRTGFVNEKKKDKNNQEGFVHIFIQ